MLKNLFLNLLLVGTDNKPELTVGPNIDGFIKGLCIFLIILIVIGGIAIYCYISYLKSKIHKLEEEISTESKKNQEE